MQIVISTEIKEKFPTLCIALLEAEVRNTENNDCLWQEIQATEATFRQNYTTETLKQRTSIAATRQAYRVLGKDPSRYRPSNEALVRRLLQGKELYHINTLVDINNLVSIRHGYSIGGFDRNKIQGDKLILGIGLANEPYEGIGRGTINIESLPVYRDTAGGIGTPTSDNERTKMDLDTQHALFLINGFDGNRNAVTSCAEDLQALLAKYAQGKDFRLTVVQSQPE